MGWPAMWALWSDEPGAARRVWCSPLCKCHLALPWVTDADDATFADIAERSRLPVVVDLSAIRAPCRMVSPALEQLASDLAGRVKLVKVNVDASPQVSQRFGVQAIPTLLLLRGGRVVSRRTRRCFAARALRAWVDGALSSPEPWATTSLHTSVRVPC